MMRPGKLEPKAIIALPRAVQMFWNRLSPETAFENILPMPPPVVLISMLGVIQTMEPPSVIMDSPSARVHVTTGKVPPMMLYRMVSSSLPLGGSTGC